MEPVTQNEILLAAEADEQTELPDPVTRKEMFLAKAAGMAVEPPEPVTREEMFLSRIGSGAQNPQGGGAEWEIIRDITLEEEVSLNIIVTTKDNGETFNYKKVACTVVVGDTALPGGWNKLAINPDLNSNVIWNGDAVVERYFSPAAKKTYFFSYELMGDSVVNTYVSELAGNVVLSNHRRKGESITEAAWVKAYETEITGVSYQVNGTFPVGSRFIFYGMK